MAARYVGKYIGKHMVSTHSHPKVAAQKTKILKMMILGFNTQPPEGGCKQAIQPSIVVKPFQHTATRRWLHVVLCYAHYAVGFQHTATRRWLRAIIKRIDITTNVSTHSHPKVAANSNAPALYQRKVSTHSHPKVAAIIVKLATNLMLKFQHTATRRWLHQ